MKLLQSLVALTTILPAISAKPRPHLSWTLKPQNSSQQFRGLSPISSTTAWLSGTNATVLLTTTSGTTWTTISPTLSPNENSSTFDFRDIHAFSAHSAVVLSIGAGNASRIYRTADAGATWKRTFVNTDAAAFYDCFAFEGAHGIALSDPVDGKFRLLETWDWGWSWKVLKASGMPDALAGEFAFAASGTCIEAKAGRWYVATGGVDPGRILRSAGGGRRWAVADSSIAGGAAAGVFSVRFRNAWHGVAVGGDYEVPTGRGQNAAWSRDGGRTWVGAEGGVGGYRSGVSWVEGRGDMAVAVGTSGSDVTFDGGRTWSALGNESFDAVECVWGGCWASGSKGRVGWLDLERL